MNSGICIIINVEPFWISPYYKDSSASIRNRENSKNERGNKSMVITIRLKKRRRAIIKYKGELNRHRRPGHPWESSKTTDRETFEDNTRSYCSWRGWISTSMAAKAHARAAARTGRKGWDVG